MKIVMFPHKRDTSAIIQNTTLSGGTSPRRHTITNRFIAHGYEDRLLWEEASSIRPKKEQPYLVVGHWQ